MAKLSTRNNLDPTTLTTGTTILPNDLRVMVESHNYAVGEVVHNVFNIFGSVGQQADNERWRPSLTGSNSLLSQPVYIPRHAQTLILQVNVAVASNSSVVLDTLQVGGANFGSLVFIGGSGITSQTTSAAVVNTGFQTASLGGRVDGVSSDPNAFIVRARCWTFRIAPGNIPDPPVTD